MHSFHFVEIVLIVILAISVYLMNRRFQKEYRKNRILQSFIAGIIRSVSDYTSRTDLASSTSDLPPRSTQIPISYETMLQNIEWEFYKDFWVREIEVWLKKDRKLFCDSRYGEDGFNFIYLDMFDRRAKEWHSESAKNK